MFVRLAAAVLHLFCHCCCCVQVNTRCLLVTNSSSLLLYRCWLKHSIRAMCCTTPPSHACNTRPVQWDSPPCKWFMRVLSVCAPPNHSSLLHSSILSPPLFELVTTLNIQTKLQGQMSTLASDRALRLKSQQQGALGGKPTGIQCFGYTPTALL
jgi:hypothetical protein